MSLANDRPLSQVDRYGQNMREASTLAEILPFVTTYNEFAAQFDDETRRRMNRVLALSTAGQLVEDRRTRGKR
jgi:hypothetical protein